MAAFLGNRESLMPAGVKRKRGSRKERTPPAEDEASPARELQPSRSEISVQSDGAKSKKKKKSNNNSIKSEEAGHKKEVKQEVKNEADSDVEMMSEGNDDIDNVKSPASVSEDFKPDEITLLLDQIESLLPTNDNTRYSTTAEKLDWTKVKVGSKTPDECKTQWLLISTKVRRFRTMRELVMDAKVWTKHPWNSFGKKTVKHPDMPKKPLTPYFRFFMSKRQRYAAKHPEMGVTELTKDLSKKYSALSERKKQKYLTSYNNDMAAWKAAMVKFKSEHPDIFKDDDKSSSYHIAGMKSGIPKTTTAMQIYINEKCADEEKKNSSQSRKQLYEQYKTIWQGLSDHKKMKYIKQAIEAKKKYDVEVDKYCAEHANFQPRVVKSFLSKVEQKIKDKHDGKPEKPPVNGYSLFTIETLPILTDIPNIERLGEVSRRWKKLPEDKKEAYNLKADERNREYKRLYSKYLESLPEDIRCKLESEDNEKQGSKKKSGTSAAPASQTSPASERPVKPVAAVFIFINDKKEAYRKKHPNMDESELQRMLVKEYNCLGDREKAKYKKLEEKEKEKLAAQEATSHATTNQTPKKAKKASFPGEPPKPPHSGYQLFSKELLVKLKDVKANERLHEIGRRWNALTEDEKEKHNKRKDSLWKHYLKEVEKFKKTLSTKDLKKFEDMNQPAKKNKKSKKKKVPTATLR